ncbi:hypothetical protein BDZ89DRAFT_1055715 [Hymenopellis radicata]|nr:hypothetical protein BDZ89DRAFT_1055715 [Hymenopellis radicata]
MDPLDTHPIFSLPKTATGPLNDARNWLELSTSTLPNFTHVSQTDDGPAPSGRRQVMVLRDSDLIVAAGKELRITHLGDTKISQSTQKQYKTLHVPNVQFDIHQIALNPSGKLLAVAGAFQVAVIVLPRPGFSRLVPDTLDCKSVQVGQFHHASTSSPPIAKIDWHPWGEAGTTLLVMTIDGKLRLAFSEYDIAVDAEDPQQLLTFVSDKKSGKSFVDEDPDDRQVASFALGKGRGDWGPLTIYAVMKSGDIYSICPYMPRNASVPAAYVHSLECFISAKRELLSQENTSSASKNLNIIYDYQQKYVAALVKQLPASAILPTSSRNVSLHAPSTMKVSPSRQGPFLLQPSPRILENSEGGAATDIVYLSFGEGYDDEEATETEHLGVVMVVYQDGRVDVCLDVEKVEARWDNKSLTTELPMLAMLALLEANYPVFMVDPIHDDALYIYHAFGVHALHLGPVLESLTVALKADDDDVNEALTKALQKSATTNVQMILSTLSVEKKCSNPVIAVTIPDNVYLTYSIFILTSAMRITTFNLVLRSESPKSRPVELPTLDEPAESSSKDISKWLKPLEGPPPFISILRETFQIPDILSRPSGLPSNPRLSLPQSAKGEFVLTPDSLRYLATTVNQMSNQIRDAQFAHRDSMNRASLLREELNNMCGKAGELQRRLQRLNGAGSIAVRTKIQRAQDRHRDLMTRLDRMLQHMMDQASPELSEHETKWFEELKRMKQELIGSGQYDGNSLVARAALLQREYDRILPELKTLLEKERAWKAKHAQRDSGLGVQARIHELEDNISRLASKLEVPLSAPPASDAD